MSNEAQHDDPIATTQAAEHRANQLSGAAWSARATAQSAQAQATRHALEVEATATTQALDGGFRGTRPAGPAAGAGPAALVLVGTVAAGGGATYQVCGRDLGFRVMGWVVAATKIAIAVARVQRPFHLTH